VGYAGPMKQRGERAASAVPRRLRRFSAPATAGVSLCALAAVLAAPPVSAAETLRASALGAAAVASAPPAQPEVEAAPAAARPAAETMTGSQGQLDTNFNPSGPTPGALTVTPAQSGYAENEGQAVAVVPTFPLLGNPQPGSGNIVVADYNGSSGTTPNASTAPSSTLYEYSPAGGLLQESVLANFDVQAVAVVPDNPSANPALSDAGDIVVAGWTIAPTPSCTNHAHHTAAVEYFSANLTPSSSGVVEVDCATTAGDTTQFNALAIDPAGRPIAAGQATDATTGPTPATLLARLTASGAPDPTFGTSSSGYEQTNASASTSSAEAVTVETVGGADQILTTGQASGATAGCDGPYAAAFDSSGNPVSSFGNDGMVNPCNETGNGTGIAVVSNPTSSAYGDIVVGGVVTTSSHVNVLDEWSPSGQPVSGFGSAGQVVAGSGFASPSVWNDITYEPSGDFIVAAGYEAGAMVTTEFVASTGAINPHFANGGSSVVGFGNRSGLLNAVAMEADGSVVVAGTAPPVGNATQVYVSELYGPPLTLSTRAAFPTSASTDQIYFLLSTPYPFTATATTTVCFVSGGPGGNPPCRQVTFNPPGTTVAEAALTVPTLAPGNGYTVAAYAVDNSGLGQIPVTPAVSTSVQHYAPSPMAYILTTNNGAVYSYGIGEPSSGPVGANPNPIAPIVGIAATPAGDGYWLAASNGYVYSYAKAASFYWYHASDVVGIAASPSGNGLYLVTSSGAVYAYGTARYMGGANTLPSHPQIRGIVANPTGTGYWEYSANGGIFSYGAPFEGAAAAYHPAQPVVAMAALPGAAGYWQVTQGGGVFTFGAAGFYGAPAAYHPSQPMVGIASDPAGDGYWILTSSGGIFSFGKAQYRGTPHPPSPMVGIAQ
jgi:hypothetical protein